MKTQYLRFAPDEEIPALACIRKRKLVKYYTRETRAPFHGSVTASRTWT